MPKDEFYQAVTHVFGRYFEVHPACVKAHHDLRREWGLDRDELETLARHIEDYSGTELGDYAALAELRTVGELVHLFRSRGRTSERAAAERCGELTCTRARTAGRARV